MHCGERQYHRSGRTPPGNGPRGALLGFSTSSTAGNAVITTHGGGSAGAFGGSTAFDFEAHAGTATLITNGGVGGGGGGRTLFLRGAKGDQARVVTNAGGTFDVSGNFFYGGTEVGSIEGAGSFVLGGSLLTAGNLNSNTTVSGQIIDAVAGGQGGRLTKVGTGALTLGGANTYSGLTNVDEGTLVVNGSIAGGAVVKNGGVLKGTGLVGNVSVEAGGVFSPGTSPGTINVEDLTLNSGSTLEFELGATRDRIVLSNSGDILLGGLLRLSVLADFNPVVGETFPLFEGAIGSIAGSFAAITTPTFNGHTLNVLYTQTKCSCKSGKRHC